MTYSDEQRFTASLLRAFFKNPRIIVEPIDRSQNCISDTQFVPPTRLPNLLCVQKDERIITYPSSITARKFELRAEIQMATNPSDRISDSTKLVGPQIKNDRPMFRRSDRI